MSRRGFGLCEGRKDSAIRSATNTRCAIAICLLLLGASHAPGQGEKFVIARGSPGFGENPQIMANIVVWQRYGKDFQSPDSIQFTTLSLRSDVPTDLAEYPVSTGVLVGPTHIFWGNDFARRPLRARSLTRLLEKDEVVVFPRGEAVAATEQHVFFEIGESIPAGKRQGRIVAKPISALEDGPAREVCARREIPDLRRTVAASAGHLIWIDRDPLKEGDSWKIFSKRTQDLSDPDRVRLVLDTQVTSSLFLGSLGVYVALHGSNVLVQVAADPKESGRMGLALLDLDADEPPMLVAEADASDVLLMWPCISGEYAAWTETRSHFERIPYAVRLVDGRPVGSPIRLSDGTTDGSWLSIDRNILVWNGSTTSPGEGSVEAILGIELPLPGATDVGDVDIDGRIWLTDAVIILSYVYRGGWKPRLRLADVDGNGAIEHADAKALLEYLFVGSRPPHR